MGASLLAKAQCQAMKMLADLPPSRAGSLPQGFSSSQGYVNTQTIKVLHRGWLLFVQPPVPPPAPPVPPPADPVPPPAPEPEPLAPPLVPVPEPIPEEPLPPEGEPGVLSGGVVVLVGPPDLVPVASAPSLAAKLAAEALARSPASNNEVSLRVIMVRLLKGSVPVIGLTRRTLGAE
ncbi:hypothetical protein EMIT0347P_10102 [Pseudomonas sp. IT-347P]